MLDDKKVKEAMTTGLSFICAVCENWHEAVEKKHVDGDGDLVCMRYRDCFSPLRGGSFDHYKGPLGMNVLRFCYVCGKPADKAIEPQVPNGKRVGCCTTCFDNVVIGEARALRKSGRRVTFTSDQKEEQAEG